MSVTSSELGRIIELARAFNAMVRYQQAEWLDSWLAAKDTALAGFADGLVRDLATIQAALSLPWSTGPVEGQISYLKTTKRSMSGRARFDLLHTGFSKSPEMVVIQPDIAALGMPMDPILMSVDRNHP